MGSKKTKRKTRWRRNLSIFLLFAVVGVALALTLALQPTSILDYAEQFQGPPTVAKKDRALAIRFYGTATLLISDGEDALLSDGFFSRPSLWTLLFGKLDSQPENIDAAMALDDEGAFAHLRAVIPLHSHHDHAMDAAYVARKTNALLLGSSSSLNLGRGAGLPEQQLFEARPGEHFQFGDFRVELRRSKHTLLPAAIARLTGHGENIDAPLSLPAPLSAFKEGGTYSLLIEHPAGNLVIQGSANFIPGALDDFQADTVFLCTAAIAKQDAAYRRDYFKNVVLAVGAKRVIPIHWDDFTRSGNAPLPGMPPLLDDLDGAMQWLQEMAAEYPQIDFVLLESPTQVLHLQYPAGLL